MEELTSTYAFAANASPWFREHVVATGFLARFPQYAAVIAGLLPIPTDSVSAMGVRLRQGRFELLYNEHYLRKNRRMIPGILQHEVHHIVFGHLLAHQWRGLDHHDLLRLAHEMAANEPITLPLPRGAIRWQQFTAAGIRAGHSSRERYALLANSRARQRAGAQESIGQRDPASVRQTAKRSRRTKATGGDPPPRDMQPRRGMRYVDHHDHATPPTEDGRAALRKLLRESVGRLAATPAPSHPAGHLQRPIAGRSLGDWFLVIELPPAPPAHELDWRQLLREFAGSAGTGWSYRRPNRRQPDRIGQVPARTRRGQTERPKLLVAIDTSASINSAMLLAIAAELRGIAEQASITVVECDDRIRRVYPFEGSLQRVQGRGGTDLRPPFEPTLVAEHGSAGIVYFTDGLGPWPDKPPATEVLWVLVGGCPFHCPFGRQVRMSGPQPAAIASPAMNVPPKPTATAAQPTRTAGR